MQQNQFLGILDFERSGKCIFVLSWGRGGYNYLKDKPGLSTEFQ